MTSGQSIHLSSSNSNIIDIDSFNSNNNNSNKDIVSDINYQQEQQHVEDDDESYVTSKVNELNIDNNNNNKSTLHYPIEIIEDNNGQTTRGNGDDDGGGGGDDSLSLINNEYKQKQQQQQQPNYIRSDNNNFLEVLKPELINYIFLKVGAMDMVSLIGVNKQCYKIGMNEKLWLYFVENDFRVDIQEIHALIRLNGGVRSLYANLYFRKKNSLVKISSPNPLIKYFLNPISKLPSLFSRKEYKTLMYGLDGAGKTTMLYKFTRGENVRTSHTNGYNVEIVEYKSCDFICWDIGFEDSTNNSNSNSNNNNNNSSSNSNSTTTTSPKHSTTTTTGIPLQHSNSQSNIQKPPVWHHYLQDTQAIIFVIDATDRQRLDRQVREEFWKMVTDKNVQKIINGFKQPNQDYCKVKVLIYANKYDQTNNVMTTLEITQALSLYNLPDYISWHVQGCSAISEDGDGLYEGLDWISSQFDS